MDTIGILIIVFAILIIIFKGNLRFDFENYIKIFFTFFLISSASAILSHFTTLTILGFIGSFYMYCAFSLVLLHSSKVLGNKNTIIFFLIMLSFGLFSEAIGVKFGWIFGDYYYTFSNFYFGLVPFMTPISWAIIIYVSYTITNLFLRGFGSEKPNKNWNLFYLIGFIILLSVIDGFIAVNLNMILDPIAVSPQVAGWIWIGGGPYFGIPISNFLGWFLVTFVATILFRSYESFSSEKNRLKISCIDLYVFIIYLMYLLMHVAQAIRISRPEYILIGITTMGPFIILIVLMLIIYSKKQYNNKL